MATKVYVTDPQFSLADPSADEMLLCYSIVVWTEGLPPLQHVPCSEETIVAITFGEAANSIQAKVVAKIIANIPGVASNDIIFLGAWV